MMNLNSILIRFPKLTTASISLLTGIIIIIFRLTGSLEFMELSAYDYFLRLNSKKNSVNSPIVIITISEDDIKRQKSWPLTDSILAKALNTILLQSPEVVGLDIYRDFPVPPGSNELKEVFFRNHNIVPVFKMGDNRSPGIGPPYIVKENDIVGFSDLIVDSGGIVRRGILYSSDGEHIYRSFAMLISLIYLSSKDIVEESDPLNPLALKLGEGVFTPFTSNEGGYVNADTRGFQFLIDFKEGESSFQTFSLTDLLTNKIPKGTFKNRIVLIGSTADSVKDFVYTPISGSREYDRRMYGIILHAHIVNQIIRSALYGHKAMRGFDEIFEWGWILLWSIAGGMLYFFIRSFRYSLIIGIAGLTALVLISWLTFKKGLWIPLIPPAMGWFFSPILTGIQEKVNRSALMRIFSMHVSSEFANTIWKQRSHFLDKGLPKPQILTATVLFTDIQGFTTISEKMVTNEGKPGLLMEWLNKYMEVMAETIMNHEGIIDKYIGDAIMVVFGVPIARTTREEIERDTMNAVKCALSMEESLKGLNNFWRERGVEEIRMRIGIATGRLVVGSLGSKHRMEYTVIGDTVNIAARLESYEKNSNDPGLNYDRCRVLLSEESFNYVQNLFHIEPVGDVTLKGKEKSIKVYRVYGYNKS